MADTDKYLYTLQSCDSGSYPDIEKLATAVIPSNFDGLIVSIYGQPSAETYLVVALGLNAATMSAWMPGLIAANLTSCADTDADKMYRVTNCENLKDVRYVKLAAAQTIGDVLRFTGECTCWTVAELMSTYDEIPVIATTFTDCSSCREVVVAENCLFEERTLGYATMVKVPKDAPPDRGFNECCVVGKVFGDLSDTASYKNDFTSVFYQRQTPADTVTYEIIGASTGTTVLVDVTHGTLYDFDPLHTNPDLSYFKVEWRKILSTIGEDTYKIRKVTTIAGVVFNVDTEMWFKLESFSINRANGTVRLDCKQDGTLERINTNFKDSDFETGVRVVGFFGNAEDKWTQDNLVYSSKKGQPYFEGQITMENDPEYKYQATYLPECMAKELREVILWGNELFASDYNKNNHSYRYEVFPVVLSDAQGNEYNAKGRGLTMNLTFKERSKDNIKTNC